MGHRQDLIIVNNEKYELGIGEEKAEDNGTNVFGDRGLKCPKAMKDSLLNLFYVADYDQSLLNSLNIIGITCFGLDLYIDMLDSPQNYVCRVTRSKRLFIPKEACKISSDLLPVIAALISTKLVISRNINLLKSKALSRTNLKSALKRTLYDDSDTLMLSKITCATTPEDNGRFMKAQKKINLTRSE